MTLGLGRVGCSYSFLVLRNFALSVFKAVCLNSYVKLVFVGVVCISLLLWYTSTLSYNEIVDHVARWDHLGGALVMF